MPDYAPPSSSPAKGLQVTPTCIGGSVVGLFLIVFFGSWAGYEAFSANHPTPVVVSPITPVVVSQNNDKQITADSVEAAPGTSTIMVPGTSSTITFKLELSTLDNSTQEIRPLLTKEMDQLIASKVLETSVASVLGIEPTAVDVGSSRKAMTSSRKLQALRIKCAKGPKVLPPGETITIAPWAAPEYFKLEQDFRLNCINLEDPSSVQCASNQGTSSICCGQAGTPSTPVNQCPSNYPTCTDYVLDSHWGTCFSESKPMPSKITVAAYCIHSTQCKSIIASPQDFSRRKKALRIEMTPQLKNYFESSCIGSIADKPMCEWFAMALQTRIATAITNYCTCAAWGGEACANQNNYWCKSGDLTKQDKRYLAWKYPILVRLDKRVTLS